MDPIKMACVSSRAARTDRVGCPRGPWGGGDEDPHGVLFSTFCPLCILNNM